MFLNAVTRWGKSAARYLRNISLWFGMLGQGTREPEDMVLLRALFPLIIAGGSIDSSRLKRGIEILRASEELQMHFGNSLTVQVDDFVTCVLGQERADKDLFWKSPTALAINLEHGHGVFRFVDKNSAWTLTNEILVNEEYFFESLSSKPLIIDCGTHVGLGVHFFKRLYPSARIIGFEPNPDIRKIALANIDDLGLTGVEVLPYALTNKNGPVEFFVANLDSMASSLEERPRPNETYEKLEVEGRCLSAWLQEPVNLLKLDIEGAEAEVIQECEGSLHNVRYVFIEYHQGHGLKQDRLVRIIEILNRHGFTVNVGKSWGHQRRTQHRPLSHVQAPYSGLIFAENSKWSHEV